jgi:circadian clock protein KaiB
MKRQRPGARPSAGKEPRGKARPASKKPRASAARPPPTAPLERYSFQLFVTGSTLRSAQAIANLRALCDQYLPGRYELEVIDMYQQPEQAALGQIIAAPTLVKTFPGPLMRMVGNLADREQLLVKLNLTSPRPTPPPRDPS